MKARDTIAGKKERGAKKKNLFSFSFSFFFLLVSLFFALS